MILRTTNSNENGFETNYIDDIKSIVHARKNYETSEFLKLNFKDNCKETIAISEFVKEGDNCGNYYNDLYTSVCILSDEGKIIAKIL